MEYTTAVSKWRRNLPSLFVPGRSVCDWSLEQPDDCPRPHPACTHPHNCRPSTVLMANTTAPVSPSPVSLNASTTFPSAAGKPTIFLRRFIHLLACFRCASWAHPFAGLFKVDGPGTGTTPDSTVGANTSQHTANLRPLSRVTSHWARERGRRIGTGAAEQGAWSGEDGRTYQTWGSCLTIALHGSHALPEPRACEATCRGDTSATARSVSSSAGDCLYGECQPDEPEQASGEALDIL